jgi:hypothetical protein
MYYVGTMLCQFLSDAVKARPSPGLSTIRISAYFGVDRYPEISSFVMLNTTTS